MSFLNSLSDSFGQSKKNKRKSLAHTPAPKPVNKNPELPAARPVNVDHAFLTADLPTTQPKTAEQELRELPAPPTAAPVASQFEKDSLKMRGELDAVKRPSLVNRIFRGAMMGGARGGLFGMLGGAVGGGFDPSHRFEEMEKSQIQERYDPILQQDLKVEGIRDKRRDDLRADETFGLHRRDVESSIANRDADNKRAEEQQAFIRQNASRPDYKDIGDDKGQYLINLKDPKAAPIQIEGVGPRRVPTNGMTPNIAGEIAQSEAESTVPAFDASAAFTEELDALAHSTFGKVYEKDPKRALAMVQRDPSLVNFAKTRVSQRQATHNEQRKNKVSGARAGAMRGAVRGSNSNVGTTADYETQLNRLKNR
jgi:hypothetical protein